MNVLAKFSFIIAISLVLIVSNAAATIDMPHQVTCPICDTRFEALMRVSQFTTGMRLDLKPIGPGTHPSPLPVCPSCHFVIYEENLQEDEKRIVSEYVKSPDYQDLAKEWPSYYLLAKLFEQVKKEDCTIAHAYLKASWQVDENPERCRECLKKSLEYLIRHLTYERNLNEEWQTLEMLAGELERRLGEFYRAEDRFKTLSFMPQFQENLFEKIIQFQLKLIEAKDTKPHDLSEGEQADR